MGRGEKGQNAAKDLGKEMNPDTTERPVRSHLDATPLLYFKSRSRKSLLSLRVN